MSCANWKRSHELIQFFLIFPAQTNPASPMMPSGDFKNPSEIFSSVALAAICQDAGYYPIIDKTMLAANAAAP